MKKLDDVIKKFEKEANKAVSSNRSLYEGQEIDDLYNVDIHIWRKTGMGNSLQTIAGNKVSIMTATASYLGTLIKKNVISKDELKTIINDVVINDVVNNYEVGNE